ncbi:hypothetical protein BP422_13835 [Brevibacillus formosus]|uniref:Uncharacterized protein n=1 Tax=Brevibacillus formosus TaxID=54913 RepID=A0A220MHK5_9BACL|nr:hypothetical protein [Brevibacillus formosus]ASJ54544.1 hypothetical protein BP422_13835 [Brevibacillus formosus]
MRQYKYQFFAVLLLAFWLLHPVTTVANQVEPAPKILSVTTRVNSKPAPIINHWVTLEKGGGKLEIQVEADNTEQVLFWIIPTGSQTWKYRRLIGVDSDGRDGFTLEWKYQDRIYQDHIKIEALGPDGETSFLFNVRTPR